MSLEGTRSDYIPEYSCEYQEEARYDELFIVGFWEGEYTCFFLFSSDWSRLSLGRMMESFCFEFWHVPIIEKIRDLSIQNVNKWKKCVKSLRKM
jgi:hypothetical protein